MNRVIRSSLKRLRKNRNLCLIFLNELLYFSLILTLYSIGEYARIEDSLAEISPLDSGIANILIINIFELFISISIFVGIRKYLAHKVHNKNKNHIDDSKRYSSKKFDASEELFTINYNQLKEAFGKIDIKKMAIEENSGDQSITRTVISRVVSSNHDALWGAFISMFEFWKDHSDFRNTMIENLLRLVVSSEKMQFYGSINKSFEHLYAESLQYIDEIFYNKPIIEDKKEEIKNINHKKNYLNVSVTRDEKSKSHSTTNVNRYSIYKINDTNNHLQKEHKSNNFKRVLVSSDNDNRVYINLTPSLSCIVVCIYAELHGSDITQFRNKLFEIVDKNRHEYEYLSLVIDKKFKSASHTSGSSYSEFEISSESASI